MSGDVREVVEAFSRALPAGDAAAKIERVQVSALLAQALREVRTAVPELALSDTEMAAHVGTRVPPGEDVVRFLETRAIADLCLAYACSRGDEGAVRWFLATFQPVMARIVTRGKRDGESASDHTQALLMKLLCPSPNGPPKIASYQGKSPLRSFIRIAASRMVVDVYRDRGHLPEPVELEADAVVDRLDEPDMMLLRARYQDEVRRAFERAFETLADKDRRLLRKQLVERVPLEQLGASFGVHRTTIARWCEQARHRLLDAAKADLAVRLAMGESTADSVLRLVRSELELSVQRLLGASQPRDGA